MRNQPQTYTHRDHEISVIFSRNKAEFGITGAIAGGSVHPVMVASYEDATKAIDDFLTSQAKAKRMTEKMAINVLDPDGEVRVVTGINMVNGKLTFSGEYVPPDRAKVYPAFPEIAAKVVRLRTLQEEVSKLWNDLSPLEIPVERTYGRPAMASFAYYVTKLKTEVADATTKAKELIKREA